MASSRDQQTTPSSTGEIETASNEEIKASMTAVSVALALPRLFYEYGYMFPPEERTLIRRFAEAGRSTLSGINNFVLNGVISSLSEINQRKFLNTIVMKALSEHVFLRKLMVKQTIEAAIVNEGIKQIVFLGGGYCVRALLTAMAHPEVQVIEIDRGPTRVRKVAELVALCDEREDLTLSEYGNGTIRINTNLQYVDCDLGHPSVHLSDILTQHGLDPSIETTVVLEGVTMYLNRPENTRTLHSIAEFLGEKGQLLLSYANNLRGESWLKTLLTNLGLRQSKELYQDAIPPGEVIDFVALAGFGVTSQFNSLQNLHLLGPSCAESAAWYAAHPDAMAEPYYLLRKCDLGKYASIGDVPVMQLNLPARPETTPSPETIPTPEAGSTTPAVKLPECTACRLS